MQDGQREPRAIISGYRMMQNSGQRTNADHTNKNKQKRQRIYSDQHTSPIAAATGSHIRVPCSDFADAASSQTVKIITPKPCIDVGPTSVGLAG